MRTAVAACILVALLSGCLADRPADAPAAAGLQPVTGEDPAARSTAAAPKWATGEWWRYRVFRASSGESYEVTRVVAGLDGDTYVVGMPIAEWSDDAVSFHLPGFGDVRAADLAYEVHDGMYKLLDFPLRQGGTWQAYFEFDNVTVTVQDVTEKEARISVTRNFTNPAASGLFYEALFGGDFSATAVYDAALGEIRSLDVAGFGRVEVIGHGFGWTGTVRCPRGQDFVFFEGGIGPTANGSLPMTQAHVDDRYDRVALTMAAGPLEVEDVALAGYYRERATAPDGTRYETSTLPHEGAFRYVTVGVDRPGGTWTFEHLAAGPGVAQSEGFAYEVHDVTLPGLQVTRPSRGG